MSNQLEITKQYYTAFAAGDRAFIEQHITHDFSFSSPPDPHLDRVGYFERCWPHAGKGYLYNYTRLIELDNIVVVTYEMTLPGKRGLNTEVLTFEGERIKRAEVYFGWSI